MANGKYSDNYASFWIAHNAMLAFLKTWERQNKWCESLEELADPVRDGKRLYSPDFGWMYVGDGEGRGPLLGTSSCPFCGEKEGYFKAAQFPELPAEASYRLQKVGGAILGMVK